MADWDLLFVDVRVATMQEDRDGFGVIDDAAVAVRDERIAWVGRADDLPRRKARETRRLAGRWMTPALVDCHTHLLFAGDRTAEFERRLAGASYEQIARDGGGILATVRATRAADLDMLYDTGMRRLRMAAADGVATVEVKSGYGLDVATELRMLGVARNLGRTAGPQVVTTLLAAHAVPPEYAGRADAWIDRIIDELLPATVEDDLADAVDAYCESVAFSAPQVAKLFDAATAVGLPVRLHADQLSDGGGAALAAHYGALSADHLEYAPEAGIRAMAKAGTVAVVLPGAFLTLGETRLPPVAAMREAGVAMAVATDLNPGTSPLGSLPLAMALAARLFGLTPVECLAGTTRVAARALGLDDRGVVAAGKRADLAIWDIDHPRELAYWMGGSRLSTLMIGGNDYVGDG